jgi:hypothetical protein
MVKKVAGGEEAVDGGEVDVVGVAEVWVLPAEGLHGSVGGGAGGRGLGADDVVLAVGFVPDGNDFDAVVRGLDAGLELGFRLMSEAVAHADGELAEFERVGGHTFLSF